MTQGKNSTISFIITAAFLLANTSAFAEGYTQKQNRVDDTLPKNSKPFSSSDKKDDENKNVQNSSDKRDTSTDGPRGDAVKKTPSEVNQSNPARTDNNKGNY
ncbi:MAG: hypothetical protein H0X02_12130 [Nitrosomonas sp.]|nr:hypothetical protein [Nitrosomonas sp.]